MKIFLDTLDFEVIEKYEHIISGVTTNPTMAHKFNMPDQIDMVLKLREVIGNKEIHIEAFGETEEEILKNSDKLLSTGKNLVFKIPFSQAGVKAAKHLLDMGHKTNLHLIFSINQALIASAIESTYICPLVGRLDDIGQHALNQIKEIVSAIGPFSATKVMVSSVRNPRHVQLAFMADAYAVTIPPSVLEKCFYHPLTEKGINTFREDIELMMRNENSKTKQNILPVPDSRD